MTDYDPYDVFLLFRGLSTWLALILAGFILLGVFRQSGRLIRWLRVPRIRRGGLSWSREDFTAGRLI